MVIDTSYANYLRLGRINRIPIEQQMVSLDWNWTTNEGKEREIERLMNLAEARDTPESGEASW